MNGINYSGLKKRDSYDEIVRYIETDPNKIKYPNRKATFIEQSHYMKMLGGQDYIEMEEQQNNAVKEQVKDSIVRSLGGGDGGTHSLARDSASRD
jgi:hypothetical protein